MKSHLLWALLCLIFTQITLAHGDLHQEIERLTKHIEKDKDNADLYLRRGQLNHKHGDFEKAKGDYLKVLSLKGELPVCYLLLAQLYAQNHQPDSALIFINICLENSTNNANALITRAGIYQQLGQTGNTTKDLAQAIEILETPEPRHYISIANALLSADEKQYQEALNWIRKGRAQFGQDIVLQEKEIEILTNGQEFQQAISKIEELIETFPRPEKWLFQKALIEEKMERPEKALLTYQLTLETIQNLPSRLQRTSRMIELEAKTVERIQALL